jgi:hypothetical protein
MPKYYVQSGSFRGIVVREDAQSAALWAVESVMREPNSESEQLSEGLFRLADAIGVSQRGFDRKDRRKIRTSQAVLLWMHGRDRSGYVAG